jgi:hypothetical protein
MHVPRYPVIVAALSLVHCSRPQIPPAGRSVATPLTATDSVVQLALLSALTRFSITNQRRVLVVNGESSLSSRALPDASGFAFVLLSPADIQQRADSEGEIVYLAVSSIQIVADTARLAVFLKSAFPCRPDGATVTNGVTACEWLAVRGSVGWMLSEPRNCSSLY